MSNLVIITDLQEGDQGVFELAASLRLETQNTCK
jgi:hypothetical protein